MPVRILVLGSYPAVHPRHGGQVRLAHLVEAYRSHGFEVKQASFFPAHDFYTSRPLGEADVGLPPGQLASWRGMSAALAEDLASGELVAANGFMLDALEAYCGPIDVLHLEQPWLLPVVQRLRERGRVGAFRLVYGSQNIEHVLKRAIFEEHGLRENGRLIEAIEQLERRCAGEAAVVAAVTEADAQVLGPWARTPPILAPNGVTPWCSTEQARTAWQERLGREPFALYVASGHPPNVSGLADSFGGSLAGLSPVQRLVIVGGVGERLQDSEWFRRCHILNQRRTFVAGLLADDELAAVRDLAHCHVLPVTSGGGSNLKTAEALYSGRHVVATRMALRGFEAFEDLPGLRLCEPGPPFAAAVSAVLNQPLPAPDAVSSRRRESLGWPHALATLCAAVQGLAR